MSDSKCISCIYYRKFPLVKLEGECTDPTKIIFVSAGPINAAPQVFDFSFCGNHKDNKDYSADEIIK